MKDIAVPSQKFVVNTNAEDLWYRIKNIEDNVKSNLRIISRYIQNCGAELEPYEVEAMGIAIGRTIRQFTTEMEEVESKMDNCFDRKVQ